MSSRAERIRSMAGAPSDTPTTGADPVAMKAEDIVSAFRGAQALSKTRLGPNMGLPGNAAVLVRRMIRSLQPAATAVQEDSRALTESYAKKDEKGEPIENGNGIVVDAEHFRTWRKGHDKLMSESHLVPVRKLKLSSLVPEGLKLKDIHLDSEALTNLGELLIEDVDPDEA
jgi:hypothetical protein